MTHAEIIQRLEEIVSDIDALVEYEMHPHPFGAKNGIKLLICDIKGDPSKIVKGGAAANEKCSKATGTIHA